VQFTLVQFQVLELRAVNTEFNSRQRHPTKSMPTAPSVSRKYMPANESCGQCLALVRVVAQLEHLQGTNPA
jgi:hypothetical protein